MPKLNYGYGGGKGLSYSRLLTLHECPRKFQLQEIFNVGGHRVKVDFAYGHAVAAGVQHLLADPENLNLAIVATVAAWDMGIMEEIAKNNKSIFYAIRAVQKFHAIINEPSNNFLANYEIAVFDIKGVSKPAIELSFCIKLHDGYVYEGHIDLILKEKGTDNYLILELKTTAFANLHEAMYKNSLQGLGYSIILDSITRTLSASSSYYVLYLVYKTKRMEFEPLIFPKSRAQRAKFIYSMLLDVEMLELYRTTGVYPLRGESCFNFFDPCEYLESCNLSDDSLRKLGKPHGSADSRYSSEIEYDYVFDIDSILEHQQEILDETIIPTTSI